MKRRFITLAISVALCVPYEALAKTISAQWVKDQILKDNWTLRATELNQNIASENLKATKGQYDTQADLNFSYLKDESERQSPVFGTSTSQQQVKAGLSQLAPTGTQVQMQYINTKQTSDSPFAANPTLFENRVQLNLSQPLLKNTFGQNTRKTIQWAELQQEIALFQTAAQQNNVLYQGVTSYWNWYLLHRLKSINGEALSAARRLYQTNQQKLAIGLIEESDIFAFSANVDVKNAELLETESQLLQSEAALRGFLSNTDDSLSPPATDRGLGLKGSSNQELTAILHDHPEYKTLQQQLQALNIQLAMSKNKKLPQLDLEATLAMNGLDPAQGTAFSDLSNTNTIWGGGLNLNVPLQNRAARSDLRRQEFIKKQLVYSLKNLETQVFSNVRATRQAAQKAQERVRVTAQAVENQKSKWEGEVKKYEQGRSDPDLVIRYQDDYLNARKLHEAAVVGHQLTLLQQAFAEGRLAPPASSSTKGQS